MASTAFPSRDDFAALLNDSLGGEDGGFEGRVVKGTVTGIENDLAVIDVGLKSEGRVPLREFAPAPGQKAELKDIPNIEMFKHPAEGPPLGLLVRMDTAKVGKTAGEVVAELKTGNPSIWVRSPQARPDEYPEGENGFIILMHLLKEGGEKIIAERLAEILPR